MTALLLLRPLLPAGRHDVLGELLGLAECVLLFGVMMIGVVVLDERARKLSQRQARPRPRVQYLLRALGCAAVASGAALLGIHAGNGRLASVAAAGFLWSAIFALLMLGRALLRGRIRSVFWRHRPLWLADGAGAGSET